MTSLALRCRGVTKNYRRTEVVKAVDLRIDAGESIAIVGENGSGKSSLLGICAGAIKPNSGQAIDISALTPVSLYGSDLEHRLAAP